MVDLLEAKSLVMQSKHCIAVYILVDNRGDVIIMLEDEHGNTYSGAQSLKEFSEYVKPVIALVQ